MTTVNGKWLRLIGLVGCTSWLISCKQASEAPSMPMTYGVMKVNTTDSKAFTTTYSASIQGRQDIDVYPQVSGFMERLCVSEGEKVRKGQLLFVIDQVPYRAALNTAIANVKAAEAGLATAELTYNSTKELYAKKVVSEFNLKTSENSYLTAQAQLAQAQAQEVNARNNLSYTEVKSPSDGVVGMFPYRVGALVGPTIPQPLTTVSDNSTMYVYFSMNENQLMSLVRQYGCMDSVVAKMPEVQLQLNDGSIYEQPGRIESISGVIDKQTGTVGVRAVFPNEARLLHSGASGSIVMPSSYTDCIVIPQTATVRMQDKTIVYKVVDGKASTTLITVAEVNDGREYVVLDGLKAGDEIVSEGAGLVREGTQVK
ncbi:MAG: efflux RND transporter periplasmic adaptor subunit [Parabacteroides sp.]